MAPFASVKKHAFFTVDVEEWFNASVVERNLPRGVEKSYESRLQGQIDRILSLLEQKGALATFFWLSPLSQKFPTLVRSLSDAGHEIASHGMTHRRLETLTPQELQSELSDSKKALEDICGQKVHGFRAPNFSITDQALELIEQTGYSYDSSVVPGHWHRGYGQLKEHRVRSGAPYLIRPQLHEVPLTVGPFQIPCAGGAYLRHLPFPVFKALFLWESGRTASAPRKDTRWPETEENNRPNPYKACLYLHPWEVDAYQPLPQKMPWVDRVRHTRNAECVENRLKKLMTEVQFGRILDAL